MMMLKNQNTPGGYDSSGINPGAGRPMAPNATAQMPTKLPPVTAPQQAATAATPPQMQAQPQSLAPTAQNPLAPLNDYQAQVKQGSYTAPAFQGQAQFEPGNYGAAAVPTSYTAGNTQAQFEPGNYGAAAVPTSYTAGNTQAQFEPGNYGAAAVPTSYTAGNTQAQQVSAAPASAGQFDVNAFRPFADAVYSEAARKLDPQFQSQEAAFRQRMVNQGFQEGTPGFDAALANFERSRNDAYSSARNQSLAQALGAQNQFFGQNLANSQMGLQAGLANASNALQAAGLSQSDRQFGANLGQQGALANAQMQMQAQQMAQQNAQFGANLGQQGALANAQMQMQAQQMAQQDRQFGATQQFGYDQLANAFNQQNAQFGANMGLQYDQLGQQDRQFGSNANFQQSQADMQALMSLLGYGNQMDQYNNGLLGVDQQRAGALFGLIPGLTPTQLDVSGTINAGANVNAANAQASANQSNGFFNALGQIGGAAIGLNPFGFGK